APEAIAVAAVTNGEVRVRVTPRLLGPVTLGFRADYGGGTVSTGTFAINVAPPATAPLAFRASDLPVLVLTLDSDTESVMPQATALYPSPVGQLALSPRFVKWRVVPGQGAPVIAVVRNGLIHARRPGEGQIEARFGGATATLRVIVRATQQ
ncbi:MAG TPA: hypothetical protein VGG36_01475, partial [Rhizomicrobium sp.]